MKKSLFLFGATALLFTCGSTKENTTQVDKKVETADVTTFANTITSSELKEKLYVYASDEFEGRETGEPGQKMAAEYIKKHYIDLKVKPAQANGDYFQNVPLESKGVPTVALNVNGESMTVFEDFVSVASAPNADINSSEMVYVGFGIDDEKYSDYNNIDVKGKFIVINTGEPKNANGTFVISGTEKATKWSNGRQAFSAKRKVAKDHGAKGVFYIDDAIFGMYANYLKRMADKGSGSLSLKGDDDSPMYVFIGGNKLANTIHKDLNALASSKTIEANMTLSFKNDMKDVTSENVVAVIKGSEKPDEYIVISSHLDHIGMEENGDVNNGADDDGSGTVAVLEIAEAFKAAADQGQGPKRSIIFLHVTGEEKGLLGSQYYTDIEPVVPLANTVANLNIDMIGRIDPKREGDRNYLYLIGSDKLSTELHELSEKVNQTYTNIEFDYTYNDENDPNRFYYRSDHYNFAKNNIPIIFYFNGTHEDYHKIGDTPDKIEYDLLENRTRLIFYTAWELANRDTRIIADKAQKEAIGSK